MPTSLFFYSFPLIFSFSFLFLPTCFSTNHQKKGMKNFENHHRIGTLYVSSGHSHIWHSPSLLPFGLGFRLFAVFFFFLFCHSCWALTVLPRSRRQVTFSIEFPQGSLPEAASESKKKPKWRSLLPPQLFFSSSPGVEFFCFA